MKIAVALTQDPRQAEEFRAAMRDLPGLHLESVVNSAKAAGDTLRRVPVDIFVADLFLGDTSGLELVKNIKKTNERITFILVTRLRDRGTVDKAFRFGASDVLPYPFRGELLRETLKHRLHSLGVAAAAVKAESNP